MTKLIISSGLGLLIRRSLLGLAFLVTTFLVAELAANERSRPVSA